MTSCRPHPITSLRFIIDPHWRTAYRATIWYSTGNSKSFDYRNTFHIENYELKWCKLVCTFLNQLFTLEEYQQSATTDPVRGQLQNLWRICSLEFHLNTLLGITRLNNICRNWSDFSNDLLACLNADARAMDFVKTLVEIRLKSFWHASLTLYRFYCLPARGIYILQQL